MRAARRRQWDPLEPLGWPWSWSRKTWAGSGNRVDRGRMGALRSLIRKRSRDPRIRAVALRILRLYMVPARAHWRQARALQGWMQSDITWVPEKGDQFFDPLKTLQIGAGDCDCQAALLGSMLESIGLPTRLSIVQKNGLGVHVFVKVGLPPRNPRRWIPVETALPVPMGWDPSKASPEEIRRLT